MNDISQDAAVDDIVAAFLENELMRGLEDYVARGRTYAAADVDTLNATWAAHFRTFCAGDAQVARDLLDCGAELKLRKLPLPEDLVGDAIAGAGTWLRAGGIEVSPDGRRRLDAFLQPCPRPN